MSTGEHQGNGDQEFKSSTDPVELRRVEKSIQAANLNGGEPSDYARYSGFPRVQQEADAEVAAYAEKWHQDSAIEDQAIADNKREEAATETDSRAKQELLESATLYARDANKARNSAGLAGEAALQKHRDERRSAA